MARINNRNKITGLIGNVVFKEVNGQLILQSRPGKNGVHQTTATKKSATDFGNNSVNSKKLYQAMQTLLLGYNDGSMAYRFRAQSYQGVLADTQHPRGQKTLWHGNPHVLQGFEFNLNSLYSNYCSVPTAFNINTNHTVTLDITSFVPKTDLLLPANTQQLTLCFMVNAYHSTTMAVQHQQLFTLPITNVQNTQQAISFTSSVIPVQSLVLVTACILYYNHSAALGNICLNHKGMHPAAIVGVGTIAL